MKISALLGNAEFFGSDIGNGPAEIAVILPVYDFSLEILKQVIESILCQKGVSFELILVAEGVLDDKSKEYIFPYIHESKLSLFLFKDKLNLPPISFYYGYLKSLAEYFIFSRQDFIFSEGSFSALFSIIKESNYKIAFGLAEDPQVKVSNRIVDIRYLNNQNIFSLSSAMIHRSIFESIGLFDPHPLLWHEFDWDFWLRISSQYPILQTDIFVGKREIGANSTSFWEVYRSEYCAQKIMKTDRNKLLLTENFSRLDVFREINREIDGLARPYLEDVKLALQKQKNINLEINATIKDKPRKIFILSPKEPSPFYPFFALKEMGEFEIIFGDLNFGLESKDLMAADLVVINRYLFDYLPIIKKLNQLNIPWVYFIDDNFTLLAQEKYLQGFDWYTYDNLRTHLSTAYAVFVSTEALKKEYTKEALHSQLYILRPIISYNLLQSSSKFFKIPKVCSHFHVAMIGGAFRYENFIQVVLPALITLSETTKIILWSVCDIPASVILPSTIEVKKLSMQADYEQFILSLAVLSIDCIVHPYGATGDIPYKTDAVILMARYLNANIIVGDEPCFKMVSEKEGVLKAQNTTQSFYNVFLKLTDKHFRAQKRAEQINYCEIHYSPDANKKQLKAILEEMPPVSSFEIERREKEMANFFFERKEVAKETKFIQNKGIKGLLKATAKRIKLYLLKALEDAKLSS